MLNALSLTAAASPQKKLHWIPHFIESGIEPKAARDYQDKALWGYIDHTGQFVVKPIFDWAEQFYDGAGEVTISKQNFLVDKSGRTVAARSDEDTHDCNTDKEIKFEKDLLDATGKLLIPKPEDVTVYAFSEGYAQFCMPHRYVKKHYPQYHQKFDDYEQKNDTEREERKKDGHFGFIDEAGKIVIPPKYYRVKPFKNGLAEVEYSNEGSIRSGWVNSKGELLGGQLFGGVGQFINERAVITNYTKPDMTYSIIDSKGKIIVDALEEANEFYNGVASIKRDHKWSLIDTDGKVLKELPYLKVNYYRDGLALVSTDLGSGYIDDKGDLVIPLRFAHAENFHKGLAPASIKLDLAQRQAILNQFKEWKIGYINTAGKFVIAPKYIGARHFREGLAPVRIGYKWGYIDINGKLKIPAIYDDARSFSEGLAPARQGPLWGYIDKTGQWQIKPRFRKDENSFSQIPIGNFSEGMALTQLSGESWRFIDRHGNYCFKRGPWEWVRDTNNVFHEGLASVRLESDQGETQGYMDKLGQVKFKGFSSGSSFAEGLARVTIRKSYSHPHKTGYIDKTGKLVIAAKYDDGKSFSEGLAAVATGYHLPRHFVGKWKFIDRKGRTLTNGNFDDVKNFSGGMAAVKIKDNWGFINKLGQLTIKPRYDYVESFANGRALVKSKDRFGYIDKTGRIILPIKYSLAASFSDGRALVVVPSQPDIAFNTNESIAFELKPNQKVEDCLLELPDAE
jgi:hypothetical protein